MWEAGNEQQVSSYIDDLAKPSSAGLLWPKPRAGP